MDLGAYGIVLTLRAESLALARALIYLVLRPLDAQKLVLKPWLRPGTYSHFVFPFLHFKRPYFNRSGAMSAKGKRVYDPKPPIPFKEVEEKEKDKINTAKVQLRSNPAAPNSPKVERQLPIFKNGTAEQIIHWRKLLSEVEVALPLTTGTSLLMMARNLLGGRAKSIFNVKFATALGDANMAQEEEDDDAAPLTEATVSKEVVTSALQQLTAYYVGDKSALFVQTRAMMTKFFKGRDQRMREFSDRMFTLNEYLSFFPPAFNQTQMISDEIMLNIIYTAIPDEWKYALASQAFEIHEHTLDELLAQCDALESLQHFKEGKDDTPSAGEPKKKKSRAQGKKQWCPLHNTNKHDISECREMLEQAKKMRQGWANQGVGRRVEKSQRRSNLAS